MDDAHLVRALDIARNSKDLIKNEWDNFLKYGEDKLVELGILGDTIENGGLLNVTGLQRLHNGAIWQGYVRQQELQVRVKELETKLLALEGADDATATAAESTAKATRDTKIAAFEA